MPQVANGFALTTTKSAGFKVCRDSGQAESRMADFENRNGAYFLVRKYGSAEDRHSQAGIT
ncbi:hypothetical protein A9K66_04870 [Mesorhizobium sp. AA23]|nr:hypothetical protein A9K66_04870 [Mesorhizobium sp. AA23]